MSASVAYASATWGAASAIGQHYGVGRFDAESTMVPFQKESAQSVSYTVPAGVKITSPTILAVTSRSWCASPGNAARAGTAYLRVNGVDKMEFAIYETGWWEPAGSLPDNAGIAAIQATTDALVISSGKVAADIKAVNGYAVSGTGAAGNEWGPA